jgi:hypothetical protein
MLCLSHERLPRPFRDICTSFIRQSSFPFHQRPQQNHSGAQPPSSSTDLSIILDARSARSSSLELGSDSGSRIHCTLMNGFDENLESASCHQLGMEATAPIFLEREWFLTDDEFDGWPRTYRLSGHPSGDVGRCTMYLAGRLDDAEYGCQVALMGKVWSSATIVLLWSGLRKTCGGFCRYLKMFRLPCLGREVSGVKGSGCPPIARRNSCFGSTCMALHEIRMT